MQLLVSVRSIAEALAAAGAGADLVDLKEPRNGALGALPARRIGAIVATLRRHHPGTAVSATIGDVVEPDTVQRAVRVVARTGVDYVKVGVPGGPRARALLEALATAPAGIVPVLLCDGSCDLEAWRLAARASFAALMADTRHKDAGSLFDCVELETLAAMLRVARENGHAVGLAGSLRATDVPRLAALAPDFAGFRGAVCAGDRTAALDPRKVSALAAALRASGARALCAVGE